MHVAAEEGRVLHETFDDPGHAPAFSEHVGLHGGC